jgi:ABC-type arginine transport system permease subunit
MAMMGAKIIVLLFGYEVLRSELRGKVRGLGMVTLAALAVVALRGLSGSAQFLLADPTYIALIGFSAFFVTAQIAPRGAK